MTRLNFAVAMYFLLCSGVGAVMGVGSAVAMDVWLPDLFFAGMTMTSIAIIGLTING